MNWRPILVLALVVGAALAGWALWTHRMPPSTVAAAGDRPDYRLDDFELVSLDAAGRESFTLRAPTLVRSPGDRTMSLTTPVFFVPNGEGKHWEIRSRSGWVSADQKMCIRDRVRTRRHGCARCARRRARCRCRGRGRPARRVRAAA